MLVYFVVVAFVNTRLAESTMSLDSVIRREHKIVAQFRRLRSADPESEDLAHIVSMELMQLGLGIEIIELRDRDSVQSCLSS